MRFVNRKKELEHLEREYSEQKAKLIVVYGRRRVGKTRLITEFIKNKIDSVYYLAAQEKDSQQIEEFKEVLSALLKDEFLRQNKFESWKSLFSYLEKVWPQQKRIILVIDEVTYIIKSNPSFTSYLQKFWDSFLCKTKTLLILSGSLVGLMLEEVLGHGSPLYGRRTSQLKVEPFDFNEAREFLKGRSLEEQIKFYALLGGIPQYLILVSEEESFEEFVIRKCLSKEGFFYQEGLFLVSQEFRDPSTYLNILKAIAFGKTKLNDISNYTGIEGKKISSYLDLLIELGLVIKEIPATENERLFRGAIYLLKDNFLSFWNRLIYPNRSKIETNEGKLVYHEHKNELNSFIGLKFEDLCRQFVAKKINYSSIGRWWGFYRDEKNERKEVEIDICATENDKKILVLGECKWQENVEAEIILKELEEKSESVGWNKQNRTIRYFLFSKSFKNKTLAEKRKNVYLFDVNDF